jgi:hypothetical protein
MFLKINSKNINFKRLILETITIVFAVLVALAVDSWKEDMDRQDAVDIALLSITEEIKSNMGGGRVALSYNKEVVKELALKLKRFEEGESKDTSLIGYTLIELTDIAWQATNSTQIASWMKQDWLFELGRIYHEQELMDTLIKDFRSFYFTLDPEINEIKKMKYRYRHLVLMNQRVEELIELYEEFLSK